MTKRIISVVLAVVLLCPALARAEGTKRDPLNQKSSSVRVSKSDVYFEDFTSVPSGSLPSSISPQGTIKITTEEKEVKEGYSKNCLVFTDDLTTNEWKANNFNIVLPELTSGVYMFEIRYKYTPLDDVKYNGAAINICDKSNRQLQRTTISPDSGTTYFNLETADSIKFDNSGKINHDTWYTLKVVADFDKQQFDGSLLNEGTNNTVSKIDAMCLDGQPFNNISHIMFTSNRYGGVWVFDYIKVTKSPRLEEILGDIYANIVKGVPQKKIPAPQSHAVAGRINIMYNGKYKYTTLAPYAGEKGNILATAQNLSEILGLEYSRTGNEYILTNGEYELKFEVSSDIARYDGKKVQLCDKTAQSSKQLFVPVKDVCEYFGFDYGYSDNTVIIEGGEE